MNTSELGVKKASFNLDGIGMEDHCTLDELKEFLSKVSYEIVDLTKYRPPAYSWRNNRNTLVMKLEFCRLSMLSFCMLCLRCQPNEYSYFVTTEDDIFVRIWWD